MSAEDRTPGRTDAALATRLYVEAPLASGARLSLGPERAHFLTRVLRLGEGDRLALFNGRDGEWSAGIASVGKRAVEIEVLACDRPQPPTAVGPVLLLPPIRKARLEWLLEKVTELGVAEILPVVTRYAAVREANFDRWQRITIEAAEQCERLDLPRIAPMRPLAEVLADWPAARPLYYGALAAPRRSLVRLLQEQRPGSDCGFVIGPEGGFEPVELDALAKLPFAHAVSLAPHVLRAETAAICGLALIGVSAELAVEDPR